MAKGLSAGRKRIYHSAIRKSQGSPRRLNDRNGSETVSSDRIQKETVTATDVSSPIVACRGKCSQTTIAARLHGLIRTLPDLAITAIPASDMMPAGFGQTAAIAAIARTRGLWRLPEPRGHDSIDPPLMSAGLINTNRLRPSSAIRARARSVSVASAVFMAFASRTQLGPRW